MREADTNVAMFGFYIWNNVRIGFQTFGGGMLVGVGSAWFLGSNGVVIGAVAGYLTEIGFDAHLLVLRRRALVLRADRHRAFGRGGPAPGARVDRAGQRQRKAALVAAAKPAVRVMYGAAILFFVAAFIEAFWSPLTEVPFGAKIAAGVAGWAMLLARTSRLAGRAGAAR